MHRLQHLFINNQAWAQEKVAQDPEFFSRLSSQQTPRYLWIGCADSRVPANEIIGLEPGEVFVHRNVANLVVHTDFNALSVIEYAVAILKVEHIIICGHYGCGGIKAAMYPQQLGLIDNWLRHIKDIYYKYEPELEALEDETQRFQRLCEYNIYEQVYNVCRTTIVQSAWEQRQPLAVYGWVYSLHNGQLKELLEPISGLSQLPPFYQMQPSK